MILGIDASRMTTARATGVEVYSTAIIRSLLTEMHASRSTPFRQVVLYTPRALSDEILGGRYPFVEQKVMVFPRLWTQVRLSSAMISEPPDVLFIPSHVLPLVHPGKSVVTIHDVAFMKFPRAYPRMRRWYLWWSTWLAVREASRIIVPSETVKKDLVQFFSCDVGKISVIHHGFDDQYPGGLTDSHILEMFGLDGETPFILYVGRLEEKKNLVRTVEAFLKFREKYPDWKLVLAGTRGYGFEHIFRAVEKADAWNSVIMPGYVTDAERRALYERSQFVSFVSLDEGFGFPILEAASFGKSVLMSDIPVMHEVAGSSGVFVNPHDTDAIAKEMKILAGRTPDTDALKQLCARHSWERAAIQTLAVLTSVADSGRAGV